MNKFIRQEIQHIEQRLDLYQSEYERKVAELDDYICELKQLQEYLEVLKGGNK